MPVNVNTGIKPTVTMQGLNVPLHDYIDCSYTGSNLTQVVFKVGGSSGDIVATLHLTYDGSNNLLTVTKT